MHLDIKIICYSINRRFTDKTLSIGWVMSSARGIKFVRYDRTEGKASSSPTTMKLFSRCWSALKRRWSNDNYFIKQYYDTLINWGTCSEVLILLITVLYIECIEHKEVTFHPLHFPSTLSSKSHQKCKYLKAHKQLQRLCMKIFIPKHENSPYNLYVP